MSLSRKSAIFSLSFIALNSCEYQDFLVILKAFPLPPLTMNSMTSKVYFFPPCFDRKSKVNKFLFFRLRSKGINNFVVDVGDFLINPFFDTVMKMKSH